MSSFTCINCRVAFADADLQRSHYKSDWHRYNLKRKVADLPPVTAENFQARVLAQRAQVSEQEAPKSTRCEACNKHFASQNAYSNHLQSKKHKEQAVKYEQTKQEKTTVPMETEPQVTSVEEKNARNQAIKDSLWGSNTSGPSGASSSAAGEGTSGSSQPKSGPSRMEEDEDEDADSECESWEGDALGLEECLFCSFISTTLEKNVEHMTSVHGFFLPDIEYLTDLEGLITYLGQKVGEGNICLWCNERGKSFYSTRAVQQHMIDKGHCKMLFEGDVLLEYVDFYDYRSSYPDHAQQGASADGGDDEEVAPYVLDSDCFQLVLPSGASVGHRSLQRYYRQKLRPERALVRTPGAVSKVMAQYKALGWTGSKGGVAQQQAVRDVRFMKRIQFKQSMQVGVKANKLQHHYRPQVIF